MCGDAHYGDAQGGDARPPEDEFVLDIPTVRAFVADARAAIAGAEGPAGAVEALRPLFSRLLADGGWLPAGYRSPVPKSGMGGGIGQWLLFRSGSRDLCLFALVVPPGEATPVHDHLAWGLVGLYAGEQEETVFARPADRPADGEEGAGGVTTSFVRAVRPGDFYALLPPENDVHRVRTTSPGTSISIHLLANDTGCVWRHTYDPATGAASPFRSGYANRDCDPEEAGRR